MSARHSLKVHPSLQLLAVRNVQLETYMSRKILPDIDVSIAPLTKKSLYHVPIIRIFGPSVILNVSTDPNKVILTSPEDSFEDCFKRGPEVLVHVHGVFPYLYCAVPSSWTSRLPPTLCPRCDGDAFIDMGRNRALSNSPKVTAERCCKFCLDVAHLLEQRLATEDRFVRSNKKMLEVQDQYALIYDVQLVARKTIYGFQTVPSLFLKITCVRPQDNAIVGSIMKFGNALGDPCQPYELHIPYPVQFMADYDISGPDFFYFVPGDVRVRSVGEKQSHLNKLVEFDLKASQLLSQQADTTKGRKAFANTADLEPIVVMDQGRIDFPDHVEPEERRGWKELFYDRFPWDFDVRGAPAPTDSIQNLWVVRSRRQ